MSHITIGGSKMATYGPGQRFTTVVEHEGCGIAVQGHPEEIRGRLLQAREIGLAEVAFTGLGDDPIWFSLAVQWSVGVVDRATG
jgi:hypothetical protein